MNDFKDQAERIESSRHDPLLRLDQFIHRQDQTIKLLKVQIEIGRVLVFELGILVFLLLTLVVYAIWK